MEEVSEGEKEVVEEKEVEEVEVEKEPIFKETDEISLDIEEFVDEDIKEFNELTIDSGLETITLKKPNEVYFELYREARTKAKQAKRAAIISYLEAKNIKKTYMLDDLNDSDSDFDAEIEDVSESELEGL